MMFLMLLITTLDNENQWSDLISSKLRNSEREVRMSNGTRADIIDYNNNITYEVDWDRKFYEGVGQSQYYSMMYSSQKRKYRPGLILLVKDTSDLKYAWRASMLCHELEIKLVLVDVTRGVMYSESKKERVK